MKSSYDECEALYQSARAEERSTPADRQAVRAALAATLVTGIHTATTGALAASVTTAVTPGAATGLASATVLGLKGALQTFLAGNFLTGLLVGTVVGTAVSATALVVIPTHPTSTSVETTSQFAPIAKGTTTNRALPNPQTSREVVPREPSILPAAEPPTLEDAHLRTPPVSVRDPIVAPPLRTSNRPAQDRLLDEAQALAKIQDALNRHDATGAFSLIEEQNRQFPSGQLRIERAAAKVLALCSAGRSVEANQARINFIATYPNSPLTKRVIAACED
jgi:hypothetical protein